MQEPNFEDDLTYSSATSRSEQDSLAEWTLQKVLDLRDVPQVRSEIYEDRDSPLRTKKMETNQGRVSRDSQTKLAEEEDPIASLRNSRIQDYENFRMFNRPAAEEMDKENASSAANSNKMGVGIGVPEDWYMHHYCAFKQLDRYPYQQKIQIIVQRMKSGRKRIKNAFEAYKKNECEEVSTLKWSIAQVQMKDSWTLFANNLTQNYEIVRQKDIDQCQGENIDYNQQKWDSLQIAQNLAFPKDKPIPQFLQQPLQKIKLYLDFEKLQYPLNPENQIRYCHQLSKSLFKSYIFLALVYEEIIKQAKTIKNQIINKFANFQYFKSNCWYYPWRSYLNIRMQYLKEKIKPRVSIKKLLETQGNIKHYWARSQFDIMSLIDKFRYEYIRASLREIVVTLRQIGEDLFYHFVDLDFPIACIDYMDVFGKQLEKGNLMEKVKFQKLMQTVKNHKQQFENKTKKQDNSLKSKNKSSQSSLKRQGQIDVINYLHEIGIGKKVENRIQDILNFLSIQSKIEQ